MRKIGFIALLFLVGFGSCEYDTLNLKEIELPESMTYGEDIAPIFEANCSACHSGSLNPNFTAGASWGALVNGGYVDKDNPEESVLIVKINTPHPSNDPLTQVEKAKILKWIEDGAKNN